MKFRPSAALLAVGVVSLLAPAGWLQAQDRMPFRRPAGAGGPGGEEFAKPEDVLQGFDPPQQGFFTIHRKKNRVLLEVPASQLNRTFLLAMSFVGGTSYAGWQWSDLPASFVVNDKKLVLIEREVRFKADERKPLGEVVRRTYSDRVVKAMPILTMIGGNPVIDLTELCGAHAGTFFGPMGGALDASVLTVAKLKPFPKNLEFAVTMPNRAGGQLTTLHYSFSALPDPRADDYLPRVADDRIGYFLTAMKDFTDDKAAGDRFVRFCNRWDLKKADPTLPLSPPKKPIVFYIEKTVPYRYRRYVQEAILEWNKAFEKCGFTDAVVVRQQTNDNEFASYDPEDVQYNFFRWITSERSFAMGPSRVNPYTGEILDADIIFDDSMARMYLRDYELMIRKAPGKLFFSPELQRVLASDPKRYSMAHLPPELEKDGGDLADLDLPDRMGACSFGEGISHELAFAAIAGIAARPKPGATGPEWPEEFIGQVIKEVVMHEVGHTLGLRHNFKASTWRPLSDINSKDMPEATAGSVMDYNPVNVRPTATTPQGKYAPTTIGPYDYWAIEYGYKPLQNEKVELAQIASRVAEAGLAYGTDSDAAGPDPYIARWDFGQDPLEYAKQRLALATSLEKDFLDRVVQNGEGWQDARRAFGALLYEKTHAGIIAARFVGGEQTHRDHKGDPNARDPIVSVPAAKQREALAFICDELFTDKNHAYPPELVRKLAVGRWDHWGSQDGHRDPAFPLHDQVLASQQWALFGLLNPATLGRLIDQETRVASNEDVLTLPELYERLERSIFAELEKKVDAGYTPRKPFISTIRRNLQRVFAGELIDLALNRDGGPQVARTLAWHEAKVLKGRIDAVLRDGGAKLDAYSASHLEETSTRLGKAIEATFDVR